MHNSGYTQGILKLENIAGVWYVLTSDGKRGYGCVTMKDYHVSGPVLEAYVRLWSSERRPSTCLDAILHNILMCPVEVRMEGTPSKSILVSIEMAILV